MGYGVGMVTWTCEMVDLVVWELRSLAEVAMLDAYGCLGMVVCVLCRCEVLLEHTLTHWFTAETGPYLLESITMFLRCR